jgi:hypothetical protein
MEATCSAVRSWMTSQFPSLGWIGALFCAPATPHMAASVSSDTIVGTAWGRIAGDSFELDLSVAYVGRQALQGPIAQILTLHTIPGP